MYDDEDEDDEYDEEAEGLAMNDPYAQKGTEDRAFVDDQAKQYDELKKRKRDELAVMRSQMLAAQSKLARKERELHQLELDLRKSAFLDRRDRVEEARAQLPEGEQAIREQKAAREINEVVKGNAQNESEIAHNALLREVRELRTKVDENGRAISLLEHQILRQ